MRSEQGKQLSYPLRFLLLLAGFLFIIYPSPGAAQQSGTIVCVCAGVSVDRACVERQGQQSDMQQACSQACNNNVTGQFFDETCAEFCQINPTVCRVAAPAQPRRDPQVVRLQNPLGEGRTDLRVIIGDVIKEVLTVLGSITLLVFFAGGVMWLTSAGNQEKVQKGTHTMLYAVIGLFVIFAAYAIINTVIRGLTGS